MNIIGDGEMGLPTPDLMMRLDIVPFFPYIRGYEYLYYSYTI
jgi:hypothetical protein